MSSRKCSKCHKEGHNKSKCKNANVSLVDNYTQEILVTRFLLYRNYVIETNKIVSKTGLPIRGLNPPEDITENIVKFIIQNKIGDVSCKWAKAIEKSGDLFSDLEGIEEVKAFTSDGPCSFGPKKKFHVLYFLDMRDWLNDRFILWQVKLTNDSKDWKDLKMNKKQTNDDQCKEGRRPHIAFDKIQSQLGDKCVSIYEGSFEGIFNKA